MTRMDGSTANDEDLPERAREAMDGMIEGFLACGSGVERIRDRPRQFQAI